MQKPKKTAAGGMKGPAGKSVAKTQAGNRQPVKSITRVMTDLKGNVIKTEKIKLVPSSVKEAFKNGGSVSRKKTTPKKAMGGKMGKNSR